MENLTRPGMDIIGAGIPAGGKDEHFGRLTRGTGFVQIVTSSVLDTNATAQEKDLMKKGKFLSTERVNALVAAERESVGNSATVLLNGVGRTVEQVRTIREVSANVAGILQFVPPDQEEAIQMAMEFLPRLEAGEVLSPDEEDAVRGNEVYRRMLKRKGRPEERDMSPEEKMAFCIRRIAGYARTTAPAIVMLANEFPLYQVSTAPMPVDTQNDARRKAALILGVDGLPAYTQEDEARLNAEKKAKEETEATAKTGTDRHVAA